MTQAPRTHLHDAVLRARGDNVVIVRTPGDVEDGAFVAADKRMISWDATDLETRHEKCLHSRGETCFGFKPCCGAAR